ncbi:hypothetical protein ACFLWO_01895 [Chloroflexota bacterium]
MKSGLLLFGTVWNFLNEVYKGLVTRKEGMVKLWAEVKKGNSIYLNSGEYHGKGRQANITEE